MHKELSTKPKLIISNATKAVSQAIGNYNFSFVEHQKSHDSLRGGIIHYSTLDSVLNDDTHMSSGDITLYTLKYPFSSFSKVTYLAKGSRYFHG